MEPKLPPKWDENLTKKYEKVKTCVEIWKKLEEKLSKDLRKELGIYTLDAATEFVNMVKEFETKYHTQDVYQCQNCQLTGINLADGRCYRCHCEVVEKVDDKPFQPYIDAAMNYAFVVTYLIGG